jgi:hypothetical protein
MSRSEETQAPLETMSEDWSLLPWRKLEQHVYRLQKRIYRAGDAWQRPGSSQIAPVVDEVAVSPITGSAAGDAR